MKDGFEAAVVSEINKAPSESIVTCCNFHFSQCLWRQLQNIGLTVLYCTKNMNKSDSLAKYTLL